MPTCEKVTFADDATSVFTNDEHVSRVSKASSMSERSVVSQLSSLSASMWLDVDSGTNCQLFSKLVNDSGSELESRKSQDTNSGEDSPLPSLKAHISPRCSFRRETVRSYEQQIPNGVCNPLEKSCRSLHNQKKKTDWKDLVAPSIPITHIRWALARLNENSLCRKQNRRQRRLSIQFYCHVLLLRFFLAWMSNIKIRRAILQIKTPMMSRILWRWRECSEQSRQLQDCCQVIRRVAERLSTDKMRYAWQILMSNVTHFYVLRKICRSWRVVTVEALTVRRKLQAEFWSCKMQSSFWWWRVCVLSSRAIRYNNNQVMKRSFSIWLNVTSDSCERRRKIQERIRKRQQTKDRALVTLAFQKFATVRITRKKCRESVHRLFLLCEQLIVKFAFFKWVILKHRTITAEHALRTAVEVMKTSMKRSALFLWKTNAQILTKRDSALLQIVFNRWWNYKEKVIHKSCMREMVLNHWAHTLCAKALFKWKHASDRAKQKIRIPDSLRKKFSHNKIQGVQQWDSLRESNDVEGTTLRVPYLKNAVGSVYRANQCVDDWALLRSRISITTPLVTEDSCLRSFIASSKFGVNHTEVTKKLSKMHFYTDPWEGLVEPIPDHRISNENWDDALSIEFPSSNRRQSIRVFSPEVPHDSRTKSFQSKTVSGSGYTLVRHFDNTIRQANTGGDDNGSLDLWPSHVPFRTHLSDLDVRIPAWITSELGNKENNITPSQHMQDDFLNNNQTDRKDVVSWNREILSSRPLNGKLNFGDAHHYKSSVTGFHRSSTPFRLGEGDLTTGNPEKIYKPRHFRLNTDIFELDKCSDTIFFSP